MSLKEKLTTTVKEKVTNLGIGKYKRHIFICTGDKCCSSEEGLKVFDYLKKRSLEMAGSDHAFYRTKAACLRICQEGPIALVYPEGTWYKGVDLKTCEQIVNQHLIAGREYEPAKFAANPLNSEMTD